MADNISFGSTIFFATLLGLSILYLLEEWRFYRQHDALLASSQFLLIPSLLMLAGNYLAPIGLGNGIVSISIDFANFDLQILSSYVSAALVLPLFMLYWLYKQYLTKQYPGFVVRRRTYGPTSLPMLINFTTMVLLWVISSYTGYMDITAITYIMLSIVQVLSIKIMPRIRESRRQRRPRRGRRTDRVRHDPTRTLPSSSSSSATSRSSSRSRRSGVSTNPSSGVRTVNTRPSEGYRDIPVRSRNTDQRSPATRPDTTSDTRPRTRRGEQSRAGSHVAESSPAAVVPGQGIEVIPPSRQVKTVKSSRIQKYLPRGNFNREDLKCIVCYESFKTSNENVIVCPSCKFPAHERELRAWLSQSERCPRCSKEIISMGALKSSALISEKQYAKIVNKI